MFFVVLILVVLILVFATRNKNQKEIWGLEYQERSRVLQHSARSAESEGFQISKSIQEPNGFFSLLLDTTSKKFMIIRASSEESQTYNFSDLLSYEIVDDGNAVGSAAAAIGGGILFGAVGAIAASSATAGTQKTCTDLHIELVLNDFSHPRERLDFIDYETSRQSAEYARQLDALKEFASVLENIKAEANRKDLQEQIASVEQSSDIYAEIEKLHTLKEKGIITDGEFQKKKKSLLGI